MLLLNGSVTFEGCLVISIIAHLPLEDDTHFGWCKALIKYNNRL